MKKNIIKTNKKSSEKSLEDIWQGDENDPLGSYTGTADGEERPIQDADDLWK